MSHAHDTYCSFCARQPCRCDVDAGDEHVVDDAGELLDVYAYLRAAERRDRAEGWLRPMTPRES